MKKYIFILLLQLLVCNVVVYAGSVAEFSTAGFFPIKDSGRTVENFNVGWHFYKGEMPENADANSIVKADFDDSRWELVSLPHTVELSPLAVSGCRNYQGKAWYRKHFVVSEQMRGKQLFLHFEGIMGKSKIWVNGSLIKEHFGGFLPAIIDLSKAGVTSGREFVITVLADNSDDPIYPPGKPQNVLDYTYFGGIYRDCWLISSSDVYITDPNYENKVAGGGVFVSYANVSDKSADLSVATDIKNGSAQSVSLTVECSLVDPTGRVVAVKRSPLKLKSGESRAVKQALNVVNPMLWHPDQPNLYMVESRVLQNGKTIDGFATRVGVRSVEFRGVEGLYINGKRFDDKLIGVNRHQDFAYIGMALPNNTHYADVKKLRDAGCRVIRSAHYPQDPAFMDACDKLGMFVIVNTPGWQFWNDEPIFEQRVYENIRDMVRRDRNHPSVLLWEPILNETHFPERFSQNAYDCVHQEYPAAGCYAACDEVSKGAMIYDVIFCAPRDEKFYAEKGKSTYTREWGDCVDDWYSHNSYSRVLREWGEGAQLRQAQHYAKKDYGGSLTLDDLYKAPRAHVGGTMWHAFDHQRGYHPDAFYGGLMDAFRQPKYSYYMFQSQRAVDLKLPQAESGPVLYIANEMTPISSEDVVVYTNCDQVRLIMFDKDTLVQNVVRDPSGAGIPNNPVVFKGAYSFVDVRALHRASKPDQASIVAEGIVDGKVVIREKKMPSHRSDLIALSIDSELQPEANGSDIVVVIASITDKNGNIKRLAKESVVFTIEGEGEIIGDSFIGANPKICDWGTAPILVRTSTKAGKVKITASAQYAGEHAPRSATIEFTTVPSTRALNFMESYDPAKTVRVQAPGSSSARVSSPAQGNSTVKDQKPSALKKVEEDQKFFESTEN